MGNTIDGRRTERDFQSDGLKDLPASLLGGGSPPPKPTVPTSASHESPLLLSYPAVRLQTSYANPADLTADELDRETSAAHIRATQGGTPADQAYVKALDTETKLRQGPPFEKPASLSRAEVVKALDAEAAYLGMFTPDAGNQATRTGVRDATVGGHALRPATVQAHRAQIGLLQQRLRELDAHANACIEASPILTSSRAGSATPMTADQFIARLQGVPGVRLSAADEANLRAGFHELRLTICETRGVDIARGQSAEMPTLQPDVQGIARDVLAGRVATFEQTLDAVRSNPASAVALMSSYLQGEGMTEAHDRAVAAQNVYDLGSAHSDARSLEPTGMSNAHATEQTFLAVPAQHIAGAR